MLLIETSLQKPILEEISREKLPDCVLSRVTYNICNIGERNANKRVYEKAVWDKVLENSDIQTKLKDRALFGHAEHPEQTQSDLQLTSHVIFEMWVDEDKGQVFQKFDVLDTPTGRIVDSLLRAGCQVGVSTRAEGDLEEAEDDGGPYSRVIPESYNYVTTDFTADPSTFGVIPINVKRTVVAEVRRIIESKDVKEEDKEFATCLLESMKCKDKSKCKKCGCCESKKIKEGTWALPKTTEDAQKIAKLMENPLTPEVAKKELYNLLGDDILYDALDEAMDNKVEDVRPEIKSWITSMKEFKGVKPEVVKILKTIALERKTIEDIIKYELIKVGAIVEYREKKCEVTKIEEDKVTIEVPGADSSGGKEIVIGGAASVTIHTDNSIVIQPKEDTPPESILAPPEKEIEDMEAAGPLPIAQQGEEKPELRPGMPVETKDGIKGKILSVDEGKVNIETDDGTKILLDTGQIIISLITEEEPPAPEEPIEEPVPEEEPEEEIPERKVVGPEDKIAVGETIEIRNLEDTKTVMPPSKVTEVGIMIGDVDTKFHKVKTEEGGNKWYEAEAYALVKVDEGKWKLRGLSDKELKTALSHQRELQGLGLHDEELIKELEDASDATRATKKMKRADEAKMGVDYIRTMKTAVKTATNALKDKDYDAAAKALEDVADDASDAARAAKKMKRADDAKAEAEKEKESVEEEKVDERFQFPGTPKEFNVLMTWLNAGTESLLSQRLSAEYREDSEEAGVDFEQYFDRWYKDYEEALSDSGESEFVVAKEKMKKYIRDLVSKNESKVDESNIDETEDIHAMYKAAGLPAPDGKSIHTKVFHELAIEVAKGYVKSGDTGEEALEKAYPTAMKQLGKEKAVHKAHRSSESKINEIITWEELGWEDIDDLAPDLTGYKVYSLKTGKEYDIEYANEKYVVLTNGNWLPVGDAFVYDKAWQLIDSEGNVVEVLKKKPEASKEPEETWYGTKESISSTVKEMTDLRIQEASTRAERDKAIELLEELEGREDQLDKQNSGRTLEVKVLVSKLKEVAEKDGQLISALRSKLEEKALLVKDLCEKLNKDRDELKETIITTKKKHQKEIETTKKKAVEGAVKNIEKEFISQFVKLRIAEFGLKIDNNSQALLENCKTLEEVDETLDKIRDIKRRSALHSEPIEGLAVVKPKDADPEQSRVNKNVGTVFEGLGYKDSGVK